MNIRADIGAAVNDNGLRLITLYARSYNRDRGSKTGKNLGIKKIETNTRGMLQVKGPDIGDGDDFNGSNKNFGLRPSL